MASIRMRDVAAAAGCSVMTVSLALRESPQIPPATRLRIRQLADNLGYSPDPLVSALMVQRRSPRRVQADVIAVLLKTTATHRFSKRGPNFSSELWAGMQERASELGFRLEEFFVNGPMKMSGNDLGRILKARGIRGMILFPSGLSERPFPATDWSHFATVGIAFHSPELPIHRVVTDHQLSIELALDQAVRRGYRRVGLAMSRTSDHHLRSVITGRFFAWQQQFPAAKRLPLISGQEQEPDRESVIAWYRRHRPDVVIALRGNVYDWLRAEGVEIPRRTGFIQLTRREANDHSGVDPRTRQVGRTTIGILVRELHFNHFGLPETPETILVSGRWMEGKTLRPLIK